MDVLKGKRQPHVAVGLWLLAGTFSGGSSHFCVQTPIKLLSINKVFDSLHQSCLLLNLCTQWILCTLSIHQSVHECRGRSNLRSGLDLTSCKEDLKIENTVYILSGLTGALKKLNSLLNCSCWLLLLPLQRSPTLFFASDRFIVRR